MTTSEELFCVIEKLSDSSLVVLLEKAKELEAIDAKDGGNAPKRSCCPHCKSEKIVYNGKKKGKDGKKKQRYLCRDCGKTFVQTTNTVMYNSHFDESFWDEVISDTVQGCSIDYTAQRLGVHHETIFNMRHKILAALEKQPEVKENVLGGVTELDETFVLESFKGSKFGENASRMPRKHGAKATQRGLSDEFVCICTGIQRKGSAIASTVNHAKPSSEEVKSVFENRIAPGTLLLCDGLKSYNVLRSTVDCTLKNCNKVDESERNFYNLNTVNGFHSFIKDRYEYYRGLATKYLNRYSALFASSYGNRENLITLMSKAIKRPGDDMYQSNADITYC